ncbi:YchJ family protein [Nesterenkonia sp. YGD6]|uniref:YchJ family protein n=1 Tax=Nesterenkonia sp. YGD6 TaxID=2901231 RepID=UPI00237B9329|nr:YchJ family metal-binding protein [Nesterenkonia sp. YGD6]
MTENASAQPGAEQPDTDQPGAGPSDTEQRHGDPRCPCGSGDAYTACCERFHLGAPAPTAEALMRSRFSANALLHRDPGRFGGYLHRTWAAETRPALSDLTAPGPDWTRLSILGTTAGGPFHDTGTVEFVATYLDHDHQGAGGRLHELSRFRRESGQWLYVDGDVS